MSRSRGRKILSLLESSQYNGLQEDESISSVQSSPVPSLTELKVRNCV